MQNLQNLYLSIRCLLIGYICCEIGWLVEDFFQPIYLGLSNYVESLYIAFYVLMMLFVTLAILSLKKRSKILRVAGWLIVIAAILVIWSTIPESEKHKELFYNIADFCSFMSAYYIIVEYSKIIEQSALVRVKKIEQMIRKGIVFADIFFMILLIPIALSVFPNLTNTLVNIDLYIYYTIWNIFIVFLILCIIEIKKELKQQTKESSIGKEMSL